MLPLIMELTPVVGVRYPLLPRFASEIEVKTYPSGERRTVKDPPPAILKTAFDELGTHLAVAGAFGVDRRVVRRWLRDSGMKVISRPEVKYGGLVQQRLSSIEDQNKVAQLLMDEGSVSVAYFPRTDRTILLVCGSMNDYDVLRRISQVLGVAITSSKAPTQRTLPMGAVRAQGARAYVLLESLLPWLVGLKGLEAAGALRFFPRSGLISGRHTTDEFLASVWWGFARKSLSEWNSRRRAKATESELEGWAKSWVEGRVRRARRFIDAKASRPGERRGPVAGAL